MSRDPRAIAWEEKLKQAFDEIDHELEAKYGDAYPLHPNRPKRGEAANPEADGLFDVGASFTAGFGSKNGRGYVISARMVTLHHIPAEIEEKLEQFVATRLREKLPAIFPGRNLSVERDGPVFKIIGDLSLD